MAKNIEIRERLMSENVQSSKEKQTNQNTDKNSDMDFKVTK